MVLARAVIHVLARVLPHVLARVLLHVLARVIIHVHDYYSKTCVQGGIANFDIQVQSVHKKALTRQKTEAVKIQTSAATNLLNSKAEHRQPALLRVRMVRENDNNMPGPRQGGGGGGGGDEQAGHGERRRRGE